MYHFSSELWWADPVDWHSIRGAQMIILMKVVSVGYDLDARTLTTCPGIFELLGYILNPGSIIFGPWVSFKTYMKVLEPASWVSDGYFYNEDICFIDMILSLCY